MPSKKDIIKISLLIILLLISILTLYFYFKKDNNEGFVNVVDLLDKRKTIESQHISDLSSVDPELSIYPWSSKLYNIINTANNNNNNANTNTNKAIGLYKPLLNIDGKKYVKLGDMISLNTDYLPPSNNDFTILLNKNTSKYSTPSKYNLIVNFGSSNIPGYFYNIESVLDIKTNLSTTIDKINSIISINQELQNLSNTIDNMNIIKNIVLHETELSIGSSEISLFEIKDLISNNLDSDYPITTNTQINIPFGVNIDLTANQTKLSSYVNINKLISDNIKYEFITKNISNIEYNNFDINLFSLIDQNSLITILQSICENITTLYNSPDININLLNYMKLTDSLDSIHNIYTALSTITPKPLPTTFEIDNFNTNIIKNNTFLNNYASSNLSVMIGKILNFIINSKINIKYPNIKTTPTKIINDFNTNTTKYLNAGVSVETYNSIKTNLQKNINTLKVISIDDTIFNKNIKIDTSNNVNFSLNTELNNFIAFKNIINSQNISYLPLQIYEPVASNGYISLGHVFCNNIRDFYKITTSNSLACVPEHCIKEMREWQNSDKVFEYNKPNQQYWAIYKNPYTGTFISVNKPGLPNGKVNKVVACVEKCTAVDNLEKADDCARKYNNINKHIMKNVTNKPDLVGSSEEEIYLKKIKNYSNTISKLKSRAEQMQLDIDKATIVNSEMNKRKLQNYVDNQKRNIDLVTQRLEQDHNKIETNINIPLEDLNKLLQIIQNLPINQNEKQIIINNIIKNKQLIDNNIITLTEYNANINKILESCPQYDLSGLVRKDIVGDVCYGCGTPN